MLIKLYRSDEIVKGHNLKALGIQLTRHKDRANDVYTPQSKENVWLYAKMHVQSIDGQVNISYQCMADHNNNYDITNFVVCSLSKQWFCCTSHIC